MSDYHINIFYSEEDGGYIADIPDLDSCSAFGDPMSLPTTCSTSAAVKSEQGAGAASERVPMLRAPVPIITVRKIRVNCMAIV